MLLFVDIPCSVLCSYCLHLYWFDHDQCMPSNNINISAYQWLLTILCVSCWSMFWFVFVSRHYTSTRDRTCLEGAIQMFVFMWWCVGWAIWNNLFIDTCPTFPYKLMLAILIIQTLLMTTVVWFSVLMVLFLPIIMLVLRKTTVGVPNSQLQQIPPISYKAANWTSEHRECSICLNEYVENDILRRLPCDHFFHINCIDPWFSLSQTCPLCRSNVLAMDENNVRAV